MAAGASAAAHSGFCFVLPVALPGPVTAPGYMQHSAAEMNTSYSISSDSVVQSLSAQTAEIPAGISYEVIASIWLAGMAFFAAIAITQGALLYRRLREAVRVEDNVYMTDQIAAPFASGIFHPRIYLPCGLNEKERTLILFHERAHLRRRDPLIRVLAYAACCVHWFNPLVWLAYLISRRDMERSCDEMAVDTFTLSDRQAYAHLLLRFATETTPQVVPAAFGRSNTKERIEYIMSGSKYKAGAVAAILAVIALATTGCASMHFVDDNIVEEALSAYDSGEATVTNGILEIIPAEGEYKALHDEYRKAGIEVHQDGLYYEGQLIRRLTDAVAPGIIRFQHINEIGVVDVDVIRAETKLPDGSTELGGSIVRLESHPVSSHELEAPADADLLQQQTEETTTEVSNAEASFASYEETASIGEQRSPELTAGILIEASENDRSTADDSVVPKNPNENVQAVEEKNREVDSYGSRRNDEITSSAVAEENGEADSQAFRLLDELTGYGITYKNSDEGLLVWFNGRRLSGLLDESPSSTTFYGYSQGSFHPLGIVQRDASGNITGVALATDYNSWKSENGHVQHN